MNESLIIFQSEIFSLYFFIWAWAPNSNHYLKTLLDTQEMASSDSQNMGRQSGDKD